jgi:tryptophan-rich sensory protein
LVVSLLLTLGTGALGGWASASAPAFYAQLDQPDWFPPAQVFGPVWTTLYVLMAVAAWLAWRGRSPDRPVGRALALFATQLVLNALWSFLFFAWHLGTAALVDLVLMWVVLVATATAFWRIRPLAGALMLPTIAWVSFAGVLNTVSLLRNPTLLS